MNVSDTDAQSALELSTLQFSLLAPSSTYKTASSCAHGPSRDSHASPPPTGAM
jgi:hypothetical protein